MRCVSTHGRSFFLLALTSLVAGCAHESEPVAAPGFALGGYVSGLQGKGLELSDGLGHVLAVSPADGHFAFPALVPAGSHVTLSVSRQPTSPSQTCSVAQPADSAADGGALSVVLSCVTDRFPVGGSVSGLEGDGLVLASVTGEMLPIASDGSFTMPTAVASGEPFAVNVLGSPHEPTQHCSVKSGSGVVTDGPVTSVAVTCATSAFGVGGSVSGLYGTGLVLANNGGDPLSVASDGAFAFAAPAKSGTPFAVTVLTQPSDPEQECLVAGGTGIVGSGDVHSIAVTCSTFGLTVGGTVTGLLGTGLTLVNNGLDAVTVGGDGTFAFPGTVAPGSFFEVSVAAQPSHPAQTCAVTGGVGSVLHDPIHSVGVVCETNRYPVGGNVHGLVGHGLVLAQAELAGAYALPIDDNGPFELPSLVASGSVYAVTVLHQPSEPSQECVIEYASGYVEDHAQGDILVTCTTLEFQVGGTVLGLAGHGLVLGSADGDALAVEANGSFTLPRPIASGEPYAVDVVTQPKAPAQTCTVVGGAGVVGHADIASVVVACSSNEFVVGGSASGLAGSGLVLVLNGAVAVPVVANGGFAFPLGLPSGSAYEVTLAGQPSEPAQTCTLAHAQGVMSDAGAEAVAVACTTNGYRLAGSVRGLEGSGLTLDDGGAGPTAPALDGTFALPLSVASGSPYDLRVATQPHDPEQTCVVEAGSGVVGGSDVLDLAVSCTTNRYRLGGTVSGLAGTLVLKNGAGESVILAAHGASFSFPNELASGERYDVMVASDPSTPAQSCSVSNGQGTVGASDVTSIAISCSTNHYAVGGTVLGLAGGGLWLENAAGEAFFASADGPFTFPGDVASGAPYALAVKTQPSEPAQTCSVIGGAGVVGAADVTGIVVLCETDAFIVGGTVSGLTGSGLVLADGAGHAVALAGDGSFAFPLLFDSGTAYSVSVVAQPVSPSETCSVSHGAGVVAASDVREVDISCVADPHALRVVVSGLAGLGLVARIAGYADLSIEASGLHTLAAAVPSGTSYHASVLAQPTAVSQTCAFESAEGVVGPEDVTLTLVCRTDAFRVRGTVEGLAGSGLSLRTGRGAALAIASDGPFAFPLSLASGGSYAVQVETEPESPWQSCSVASGSGIVGDGDVNDVRVTCATQAYFVGGVVTGLTGTGLVLATASGEELGLEADGGFVFPTAVPSGQTYTVSVKADPSGPCQVCTVTQGAGVIAGNDIVDVAVSCDACSPD